jgi:hypothetical protein
LLRRVILIGAFALLVTAGSLTGCATKPPDSSEAREGDSPTEDTREQAKQAVARQEATGEVESSAETTTEEDSGRLRCSEEEKKEREDLRLGDFEPPEDAPEYEIVDEQPVDRYGAKAARYSWTRGRGARKNTPSSPATSSPITRRSTPSASSSPTPRTPSPTTVVP